MRIRTAGCIVLICLLPATALAAPADADTTTLVHEVLDNGLEVFVRCVPEQPLVDIGVFYAAGSAQDPEGLDGLAHFVEHLMFVSADDYPDGELGSRLDLYTTDRNASTSPFLLKTRNTCLPRFLPEVLSVEAARMGRLTPSPAEIERERAVVLEEIALRSSSTPFADLVNEVYRAGYAGHPRGRSVGGSAGSVAKITAADVEHFAAEHLRPGNAVLVINGAVDGEATLSLVRDRFAGIIDERPDERSPWPAAPFERPSTVVLDRSDMTGLWVALGLRLPRATDEDIVLAEFYAALLKTASMGSTRWSFPDENMFFLGYGTAYYRPPSSKSDANFAMQPRRFDPEADSRGIMEYLWRNVEEIADVVADEDDFIEARDAVLQRLGNDSGEQRAITESIGEAALAGGSPMSSARILAAIAELDRVTCLDFLHRWITPERSVVGVCHGSDSLRRSDMELATISRVEDRDTVADPMDAVPVEDYERVLEAYGESGLATITRLELDNGIPVWFLSRPGSGRIRIGGILRYPLLKEERAGRKRGIGVLYNWVVNEGYRSPDRAKRRYVDVGSGGRPFGAAFKCFPDHLEFNASGRSSKIGAIGRVIAKRLESDDFNLSRWRNALWRGVEHFGEGWRGPYYEAARWRRTAIFGSDHPLLGPVAPEEKTADRIKYRDLQKFHRGIAGRRDMAIVVVGDVAPDTVLEALAPNLGSRKNRKAVSSGDEPPAGPGGIEGRVVPAFEMTDVDLALAFPVVTVGGPHGIPPATLRLLTEVLRVRFRSALRTGTGLIYTVRIKSIPCHGAVCLEASVSCRPGQSPVVYETICRELDRIEDFGVDDRTIQRARLGLIRRFATGAAAEVVDLLQQMAVWGEIPTDPYAAVLAVSTAEVNTLLPRLVPRDRFVFTATGPLFEEDIEQFNLAIDE